MRKVECLRPNGLVERKILQFPGSEERRKRSIERKLPRERFELTLSGNVPSSEAWELFEQEFNPERQNIIDERLKEAIKRRKAYKGFYFNDKGVLGIWQVGAAPKGDVVLHGMATAEERAKAMGVEVSHLIGQDSYYIHRLLRRTQNGTVLKELLFKMRTKGRRKYKMDLPTDKRIS